ncbi:MAG: response regulator [Nitrosomonas sp.]|nr:response regulator [Nitrosomonas sp.]MDP1951067.1 response regulator [Nitrosomonas sp.]
MQNNLSPHDKESILVVDDDADMCWSLERLLRSNSFDVTTADCGRAALEHLKATPFDLIILDARLPDIDGLDLAQQILQKTGVAYPIVLISGYLYPNDRVVQEGLQSGLITDFVSKPFFHDAFLEIVCNKLHPISCLEGIPEA